MSQFIEMFEGDKYPSVKLSDIASEWLKGQSFRKDDIVDNGNSMCIHYGELFTKYGPIINQVLSRTNVEGKRTSKVGDILFPASDVTPNGLARCSMLPYDNIILGGDIIVFRPKRDCNAAYLSYAINQQTAQLLIRVNGAVVKHMSAKALMTVVIPMPPLEEQNRFVSLAQQADKSKFVDFKSQFIEMFGDYEMTVNFGDLFSSVRNGANIKQGAISGGIPITRIETISEGEVNRDKMGYAGIVDNTYSSYYLQDGDILVSHINSIKHIGKCALYQRINDETIIHGMNLLCLRPYKDIVHPQYLTYLLRSSIMRKLILDITKPAVNQASFTVKDLCKLKVMLPPMSEQEEFVAIVKQADKSKYFS